jgi:hypothetical protein
MFPTKFTAYDQINEVIESYIKTVADVKSVREVPLEDINSFFQGIQEYEDDKYNMLRVLKE